jgi:hypothetical protein
MSGSGYLAGLIMFLFCFVKVSSSSMHSYFILLSEKAETNLSLVTPAVRK